MNVTILPTPLTLASLEPAHRIPFVRDDGGRAAAGFRGTTGDCVVRAIAVAAELDYRETYLELRRRNKVRGARSPRFGVGRKVYEPFLAELGWTWTPTMHIGSGTTTHLRADELPEGRIVCRLSRHVAAVVDGILHDTYDCSRGGTRAVYGYFTPAT